MFDSTCKEWISARSVPLKLKNGEKYYIVTVESLQKNIKNLFLDAVDNSDYSEFLQLNFKNDTYNIIYHGKRKNNIAKLKGRISEGVYNVANRAIHPDDRNSFYQFWLMNRINEDGVPEELQTTRHVEFRKQQADGSYSWVQQVIMPFQQNNQGDVFVMSFYDVIKNPYQQDAKHNSKEIEDVRYSNKNQFFTEVREALKNKETDTRWCILSIDIENFKLFNEWHSWEIGNNLIKRIAASLKEMADRCHGVSGYFGDDNFALAMPYDKILVRELYDKLVNLPKIFNDYVGFFPAIGIYEIIDTDIPVSKMYDYAEIARASVRESYNIRIKKFNIEMLDKLKHKYILLADVKKALQNKEITFFLQPKCNMENKKIIGAEALVRWISKDKGMISPAAFIPLLEKTGFISTLDMHIWEEVCRWQRERIDQGVRTVPISVNVSRTDIFYMDVVGYFCNLIEKYELDPNLIEIEITESVYAENDHIISEVVNKFRASGFRVLMDDFGSGYSSLNMLKDIDVDVLKIDMRFLDINQENAHKGISILEAVHNMANVMGVNVIAEGVETEEQKKFLQEMGCVYGQGYHFYHPLPVDDFEQLINDRDNVEREEAIVSKIEKFYLKDLLSEDMFSEVMINNMLGAVAFYEVSDGKIIVRRYNEHYASLVGEIEYRADAERNFEAHLFEEEQEELFNMFDEARKNRHEGAECDVHRRKKDGSEIWIHLRTFFLKEQDGKRIYYSSISDNTDVYLKKRILSEQNEILTYLNNDMPGGYYRISKNQDLDFLHISRRFLDIVGFSREKIKELFDDKLMNMIHPDDRPKVLQSMKDLEETGGNCSLPYRIRSSHGYFAVWDLGRLVKHDGIEFFQGIIFCDLDYYKQMQDTEDAENQDKVVEAMRDDLMPCGIFQSEADGNHEITYVSNSMLAMLGYSRQAFIEKFHNVSDYLVYEGDRERVEAETAEQIQRGRYVSCEFRIELVDGSLKWVYSHARISIDAQGKRWFYTCIVDYDDMKKSEQ